jgi:nitrite reductase/ring-hydroxylating ferredoxin subunit
MIDPMRDPTSIQFSTRLYRLLLGAYPEDFRREYGPHMAQVFRDACFKAYRLGGLAGLFALWLRIGNDLMKTSLEERMQAEMVRAAMENPEKYPGIPTPINRREFLNFAWMASLGFLLVDIGGVAYFFSLPRLRAGQFGAEFALGRAGDVLPEPGAAPRNFAKGKFWLARTEDNRLVAPYKICPHLGCLYNWNASADIFICPCHYSQYQRDGTLIRGPAPRSADRFVIRLLDENGVEVASTDASGNPLALADEDLQVVVDTGKLIRGQPKGVRYPA